MSYFREHAGSGGGGPLLPLPPNCASVQPPFQIGHYVSAPFKTDRQ